MEILFNEEISKKLAKKVDEYSQELSKISATTKGVTRIFGSKEHREAVKLLSRWMEEANMEVEFDAVCNVVGRLKSKNSNAKTLILGSHQDTVVEGGKYDGALGIIVPIVCCHYLKEMKVELPFHVEIVGFGDEEGTRFGTTLLGSRALTGHFNFDDLEVTDKDGISIGQAITDLGGDVNAISSLKRDPSSVLGFIEVHIEQGPVLEKSNAPVGYVTSIAGGNRKTVRVKGKASHAGTTPIDLRQDALCGASEMVLFLEKLCHDNRDIIGTVGKLQVIDGAINVIPQEVEFTLDLRSGIEERLLWLSSYIKEQLQDIAKKRSISIEIEDVYHSSAVNCSENLMSVLKKGIELTTGVDEAIGLFSGAGHDSMAMAKTMDIGMLFVRCREGLSHHPDEFITVEDGGIATEVVLHVMNTLGNEAENK